MILPVAMAVVRYEYQLQLGAESVCGVYARIDDSRLKERPQTCYSLFIICESAVPKMTVKTGPAKTRPAGLLGTAMH